MDETAIGTETLMESETRGSGSEHRHSLEPISLAFGTIYVILGLVFVFGDIDADSISAAWIWASVSGAIGLLLLAVGLRRHRRAAG